QSMGLISLPDSKFNFFRCQPNPALPVLMSCPEQVGEKSLYFQGLFLTVTSHYFCAWNHFSGS
ncbi:hypothetical protein DBR06_SOUSAS6610245, partial [Sousa chinensis]